MNRKFHRWYDDLRFGQKILVINTITAGAAMLLLTLSIAVIYIFSQRNQMLEQTSIQSQVFGESLATSLSFNDTGSAREVLASLRNSPHVVHADVFDLQGQHFAEYRKDNSWSPELSQAEFKMSVKYGQMHHFGLRGLSHVSAIKLNNKTLGYFYTRSDAMPIYRQAAVFILLVVAASLIAAAAGLLLLNRLQRVLMAPLHNLIQLMRYISEENDYSKRHILRSSDEMGELAMGFNQMLQRIQDRDNALGLELKEKEITEKRLDRLAHYDVVTHLPNRHFFNRQLTSAALQGAQDKPLFGLMFIDLDDFKMVNDTLGHHFGDVLLRHVAELLTKTVRSGDVVARLGGDEFGIILPGLAREEDAAVLARKIISRISEPVTLDGREVVVGASIGISFFPGDADNVDTLMQYADTAMYHAKDNGKNNFQFFSNEMHVRIQSRRGVETDLRKALEQQQLYLEYQPQFDIDTRRIVGVETLLRWQHPELGRVGPNEFIPVAEENGLIVPIGEWVFRMACLQAKKWHAQGLPLTIAVNVSSRQFLEADLAQRLEHILCEVGANASWIELEITESALLDASDSTIGKLNALAGIGFGLAIDDFGTGYSSLSYLKRFPISKLKIDRSFIVGIQDNSNDKAIAHAIIAMGNSLDMQVIAEGIETEQQAQYLLDFGCRLGQGFLVSPSVAPEKVAELVMVSNSAMVSNMEQLQYA